MTRRPPRSTLSSSSAASDVYKRQFTHPAGWHSQDDISRIRAQISSGKEPWHTAAAVFLNDTSLSPQYQPSPRVTVCRGDQGGECGGEHELEQDSMAAYYSMLRWVLTNQSDWVDVAQRIADAWSGTLVNFTGHDQMLAAGIYGSHFAQACELLAYARLSSGSPWSLQWRAQGMFLNVFHPVCVDFCGGDTQNVQNCSRGANGNWDASCMIGVGSWAVFLDNRTMLDTVAEYYKAGTGNGRLEHYVYESGQAQESGRDQPHTMDGLEHLLECAFLYWKATGDTELLSMLGYRLRAGLEYTAKYNLNMSVPFTPNCDVYNISCFEQISSAGRGNFAPMWEMAGAVYGGSAPYVQEVLVRPGYRPEGKPAPIIHSGAHVGDGPAGHGTLSFYGMKPPQFK
eukprot:TRINITY_DN6997_c0_g1_i4.p1 TRINITY_DN6997_c0_g1~~TRINITY_DN6997_c0_g1_i4.p1  ORF type:complete len:398 (+),score=72.64 TRINITY_DN6997_c0_g1_i4:82-1275(+)